MGIDTRGTKHGYSATKDQLKNRLARIRGRCAGSSVWSTRIALHRHRHADLGDSAALDKVALGLLDDHAAHCIVGGAADSPRRLKDELMGAVARLMRRG